MSYNFSGFKQKLAGVEGWLSAELKNIQTGRATPGILDGVMVSAYGSKMPIREVATISVEDARTLRIAAWDQGNVKAIEAAVRDADLGLGVSVDALGVRVSFPELTTETRQKFTKVIGQKLEEARVSVRRERDLVWADIQKKEKEGDIAEDDKFRFKEEMERTVRDVNEKLDAHAARKEKEILG